MGKQRILLTGASGGMGTAVLRELLRDEGACDILILSQDTPRDRAQLRAVEGRKGVTVHWGDLTRYADVEACVRNADLILHVAALVSPAADYYPALAMKVNSGGMRNLIEAIRTQGRMDAVKLVSIGTVAETGDRMPPIHWGRVGDPVKPGVFDYYAVSKVAAERLLVESGLRRWVSLRQTGIMGPAMCRVKDAIIFHNCLNNVLEYVSDRDSGAMLGNLARLDRAGELPEAFWGHIYNVGGGESCRVSAYDMFRELYGALGFTDLKYVLDPRWFATRNFHGQYYLDSDRLENYLHFRHDSMRYFYDAYLQSLGTTAAAARLLCRLPGGQKLMGALLRRTFRRYARGGARHGALHRAEHGGADRRLLGSRRNWEAIPADINDFKLFTDWDRVVPIGHGYDETKPESELTLADVRGAAVFRGGACLSDEMATGDWQSRLAFRCAFGHPFTASPRLVLEGGHWCPQCERESWNYAARAKVDPFFTQVWAPLHGADEQEREYKKNVSELDV
jgi:nucleoside-diphosphate-sugar epimerase